MKQTLLALLMLFAFSSVDAQIFKKKSRTVTTDYQLVDSLPDSISFGKVVLFDGTLWRGLNAGESSLPAKTPWPVKGYKEVTFNYVMGATDSTSTEIIVTDGIGNLTFTGTWLSVSIAFGAGVAATYIPVVTSYTVIDVATTTPFLAHAVQDSGATVEVVVDSGGAAYDATLTVRFYPPAP